LQRKTRPEVENFAPGGLKFSLQGYGPLVALCFIGNLN